MAIDYGNYVGTYGGGVNTGAISQGITRAFENNKRNALSKAQQGIVTQWNVMRSPFDSIQSMDASTILSQNGAAAVTNLLNSKYDDAYNDYKAWADGLPNLQKSAIYASGELNPMEFKQKFDAMKLEASQTLEKKFNTYQKVNFKSDDEMRDLYKEFGLQNYIINNFGAESEVRKSAMPEPNWEEWYQGLGPAQRAGVLWGAPFLGVDIWRKGGLTKPVTSGASFLKNPKAHTQQKMMNKYLTDDNKMVKDLDKTLKGAQTKSQTLLDQANKNYDDALKKYGKGKKLKGKSLQTAFNKTKNGQTLINKVTRGKTLVSKTSSKASEGAMNYIKKYIKKHGVKGVMSKIIKKGGWKMAAGIVGKLGVGGLATFSGIGTAAGILMNAHTIYQLYSILTDED